MIPMQTKTTFYVICFFSTSLLLFGYYLEYQLLLEPCPLCMTQRLCFMGLIAIAFCGFFTKTPRTQSFILTTLLLVTLFGAAIAARQLWLQMLPQGSAPACGPGFYYLVEIFPAQEVLKTMLIGDGNCAEIVWTFLGISIPGWSLIWFGFFFVLLLSRLLKKRTKIASRSA